VFATGTAWTLFIALVVFANDGNEIYAKIGALASLTLLVSLATSYVFGHTIDRRGGGTLLIASAIVNSIVHLFRSTIQTWVGIVANNAANEVATTGYAMAFTRGMFDTADKSGHRILYLFFIELTVNLGALLACLLFAVCCLLFDGVGGFGPFYAIVALLTLVIGFPRFMLYKK
jgi:MFS family permease